MIMNQQKPNPYAGVMNGSAFSGITKDPAMQQGLLGNWAFNMANQGENGGRSFFENLGNFPQQGGGNVFSGMQNDSAMNIFGQQNNNQNLQGVSDKLLSAYDSHVNTPNLQADIMFQDNFMGGNNNEKQDIGWGLLG